MGHSVTAGGSDRIGERTYGRWEVQALCSHALAWWLERHDGRAKCDPQERSKRATERVADDPYICIRVHKGNVVVQILFFLPPWG